MTAKVINHEEAIKNLTAERYLLGELSEGDRDAYEEHLFSCPICFEQIKVGTEFVGHLRRIGTQNPAPVFVPGFMSRIGTNVSQMAAAGAFVLLLCVSGISIHQQRVISGLRAPQITPSFFLSDGAKAGGIATLVLPRKTRFELDIQVQQSGGFSSYQGLVLNESQQIKYSFPITAEQIKDTIHLVLDSSVLRPGTYSLVVNGFKPDGMKTEITRYSFELQAKE